jgi:hypothetical protein
VLRLQTVEPGTSFRITNRLSVELSIVDDSASFTEGISLLNSTISIVSLSFFAASPIGRLEAVASRIGLV